VEFVLGLPDGTPAPDIEQRESAKAAASAELGRQGKLLRLWRPAGAPGQGMALALFRVDSREELDTLLGALPLADWMQTAVTPLETHPHDPASRQAARPPA
jgi:muconolactone D-isomerase